MFDHLLPLIYADYEFFDESNKENFGYVIRRRARFDLTVDTSFSSASSFSMTDDSAATRRRALRCISPIEKTGVKKSVAQMRKRTSHKKARKSGKKDAKKATSSSAKSTVVSKSVAAKRRPLQDITHLYVSEQSQVVTRRERSSCGLKTSVAMRFF